MVIAHLKIVIDYDILMLSHHIRIEEFFLYSLLRSVQSLKENVHTGN